LARLWIPGELRQEGNPEPITAQIRQETLAGMIGATFQRIGFFMNTFR
jgi:CRP/FNR family transcriptional regulator, cyclic AMP receptor protein